MLNLTLPQYLDMVNAKMTYLNIEDDKEMERTAWQSSLLMSATGNYGKKGIEHKKLYERQYDDMGNRIKSKNSGSAFSPIDKQDKDRKLNELIAKFNKE